MRHGGSIVPSGVERVFRDDEVIVSKTDLQGRITYANEVFLRVSAFTERDVLGQPHNLIRHPEMPRVIFQLLWDSMRSGDELFAYLVNLAADGAHYWVLAHISPSFDASGACVGYHSNRRTAAPAALEQIQPLYAALRAEERRHPSSADALAASTALLEASMAARGHTFEEFVWSLEPDPVAVPR